MARKAYILVFFDLCEIETQWSDMSSAQAVTAVCGCRTICENTIILQCFADLKVPLLLLSLYFFRILFPSKAKLADILLES